MPPSGPRYLPRWLAGTMSAMIDCDRIMSPPPPRPCAARKTTNDQKSPANAQPTEASVKIAMAARKRFRRPSTSPNLP